MMRQSEDYCFDGKTWCVMGEDGDWELYELNEADDEWEPSGLDQAIEDMDSTLISYFTSIIKTILKRDTWCA
jgi:hypothetical protein